MKSTVGVGSTFTVTIPLRYGEEKKKESVGVWEYGSRDVPHTPTVPYSHTFPLVLVIDDEPDVIYLLRENLTEAGYRVIGATNRDEGLQQARVLKPFAIILDIMMPHKDGWQVLHARIAFW